MLLIYTKKASSTIILYFSSINNAYSVCIARIEELKKIPARELSKKDRKLKSENCSRVQNVLNIFYNLHKENIKIDKKIKDKYNFYKLPKKEQKLIILHYKITNIIQ